MARVRRHMQVPSRLLSLLHLLFLVNFIMKRVHEHPLTPQPKRTTSPPGYVPYMFQPAMPHVTVVAALEVQKPTSHSCAPHHDLLADRAPTANAGDFQANAHISAASVS